MTQFLAGNAQRSCKYINDPQDDKALRTEFDVGDTAKVWRRFRINLIDSSILVYDQSRGWLSLEDWRKLSDSTAPITQPTSQL